MADKEIGSLTAAGAVGGTEELIITQSSNSRRVSVNNLLATRTITSGDGLTGGGTLAADKTLAVGAGTGISVAADSVSVDINGLSADASPDAAADYVMTYDASATTLKKVLLEDLPGSSATFSGALVNKAADQTTANYTTATAVAWDEEEYDEGGWHDNVTNNSRLTVPSGVTRVTVGAGITISNIVDGSRVLTYIFKNGAAFVGSPQTEYDSTSAAVSRISVRSPAIAVTAGDYFQIFLEVTGDTSITVHSADSWFSIEKVS